MTSYVNFPEPKTQSVLNVLNKLVFYSSHSQLCLNQIFP